jgi:hypothetical protein
MASLHEFVRIPGRLFGAGRNVECTVFAQKKSLPGTDHYEYAHASIMGEPKDLPDGFYDVAFDGRTIKVQRMGGAWVAAG